MDDLRELVAMWQKWGDDDPYEGVPARDAAGALSAALDECDRLRLIHGASSTEAYQIFEEQLREAEDERDRLRNAIAWALEIYGMPESERTLREALAPQEACGG